ncbi:MAG: hypothetical protein WAV45_00420 [Propionibacteriaceae bacterium]|nr:hypothetical protein [Micropruina sp.]HBX81988.1 hypothetical protein [Propionibacteriaceae bacterium]HBY23183.1 hypothetical protein [Propionibacteriaceae bacterium]
MLTTRATADGHFSDRERKWWAGLFVIAAVWNFAGAVPGFLDTSAMFAREFGRDLTDPVMVIIYRGAWGTALLYGLGFLIVARNPERHTGVVLMGGLGKAFFAFHLLYMYLNDWTSDFALVVIAGDAVFVVLFLAYFASVRRHGHTLL